MTSSRWERLLLFSLLLFAELSFAQFATNKNGETLFDHRGEPIPEYNEEMVKDRLRDMECLFHPKYMSTVKGYVKGYTIRSREKAEHIIGRAAMYFPLFEEYLAKHDMPDELKYLSVVESALVPIALSRSGAGGLWQFMPETGRHFGLQIDDYADQRSDPHRATEAALTYLRQLHDRFGSWELALAAYNGGPGRVNRAIRRSGSKDFWRLRRYLPRETRNYVPAFIAATYLMKNYKAHNLQPYRIPLDYQLTTSVKVYAGTSLAQVAEVCDLPLTLVENLNPSYLMGFIPGTASGNHLILPKRVLPAFLDFEKRRRDRDPSVMQVAYRSRPMDPEADRKYYQPMSFFVGEGETIQSIARDFSCPVRCLMDWNDLEQPYVRPGQELTIYRARRPEELLPPRPKFQDISVLTAPELAQVRSVVPVSLRVVGRSQPAPEVSRVPKKVRLQPGETIPEIARRYAISVDRLMRLNGLTPTRLPKAGDSVRLR